MCCKRKSTSVVHTLQKILHNPIQNLKKEKNWVEKYANIYIFNHISF